MKMYFKQRLFSWFDCYDIYDEDGHTLYRVEGQLSWGHCLKIFDTSDQEVGRVEEKLFRLLPKFEMYAGIEYIGCISRDFSWFRPSYYVDCKNWQVKGSFMQWDYQVTRLATTGGFLRAGNTTLIIGTEDDRVERAIEVIGEYSRRRTEVVPSTASYDIGRYASFPMEVQVGGATIFVVDVEQFVKL